MNNAIWKKSVIQAFVDCGFARDGKLLRYSGPEIIFLCSFQKCDFSEQWFINIGFWLTGLGSEIPARVELTHLNYRLESLFPDFREVILTAGAFDEESQAQSFETFLNLLRTVICPKLIELLNMQSFKQAFRSGLLNNGLVRKEARAFLTR